MIKFDDHDLKKIIERLDKQTSEKPPFNAVEHDKNARLEITKLFLKWFFGLIAAAFVFTALYNYVSGMLDFYFLKDNPIKYIDITNTVSIITTPLGGALGFVMGFYFKNSE